MVKYRKPTGKELIRALEKNGYKKKKQKGSHVIMQSEHDKKIIFSIPNYTETLSYDLLDRIRKYNLKISKEEFRKILEDC